MNLELPGSLDPELLLRLFFTNTWQILISKCFISIRDSEMKYYLVPRFFIVNIFLKSLCQIIPTSYFTVLTLWPETSWEAKKYVFWKKLQLCGEGSCRWELFMWKQDFCLQVTSATAHSQFLITVYNNLISMTIKGDALPLLCTPDTCF